MNTGGQTKAQPAAMSTEIEAQPTTLNNGSAVLIQALQDQGVEIIFGYPGGAVLPIYDALYKNPISQIVLFLQTIIIHLLVKIHSHLQTLPLAYNMST